MGLPIDLPSSPRPPAIEPLPPAPDSNKSLLGGGGHLGQTLPFPLDFVHSFASVCTFLLCICFGLYLYLDALQPSGDRSWTFLCPQSILMALNDVIGSQFIVEFKIHGHGHIHAGDGDDACEQGMQIGTR